MDIIPTGETVTKHDDGRIEILPGTIPETEPQKTVEVAIEMRPDTALNMVAALLDALQRMPADRKSLYGIPASFPQIRPRI
jgi:hypothetical protein